VKPSLIAKSIRVARKNWNDWRDVFEHEGPICENPLLADPHRFKSFLKEFSVSRTIKGGTHDELRGTLVESGRLTKAIRDDSGHGIDKIEGGLRNKFGTDGVGGGKKHIVSALSKVAAFVRPERFVAWDRYAKKGLNTVLGRAASTKFDSYADYLADFDRVWRGKLGQEIRSYVRRNGSENAIQRQPRFLRRVLDVHLMRCGGRDL
jgi:hypothetical protein